MQLASSGLKQVHQDEKSTMMAAYVSPATDVLGLEMSMSRRFNCSSDIVMLWFRTYGKIVLAMLFSEEVWYNLISGTNLQ